MQPDLLRITIALDWVIEDWDLLRSPCSYAVIILTCSRPVNI